MPLDCGHRWVRYIGWMVLLQGSGIPGRVTNARHARQISNDAVEFIGFYREADQRGYDFGDVVRLVDHLGVSHRIIGSRKLFEQEFPNRCDWSWNLS